MIGTKRKPDTEILLISIKSIIDYHLGMCFLLAERDSFGLFFDSV
jgi:hypothetical protein